MDILTCAIIGGIIGGIIGLINYFKNNKKDKGEK